MAAKEKRLIPEETQEFLNPILTGPANKAWRALILINRAKSPMPKVEEPSAIEKTGNIHIANKTSFSASQLNDKWTSTKALNNFDKDKTKLAIEAKAKNYTLGKRNNLTAPKNEIIIINTNTVPATCLTIQNRPNEINIESVSTWASVKSFGRNDPFQIYNGSEKTITFEISWYSVDSVNRDDVVTKCKLLESWTKSDGYRTAPPLLKLVWGGSGIFENDEFILSSAPYKLTHFQSGHIKRDEVTMVKDLKLLPNFATQTLIFKKVTSGNTTYDQMVNPEILKRTIGVKQ